MTRIVTVAVCIFVLTSALYGQTNPATRDFEQKLQSLRQKAGEATKQIETRFTEEVDKAKAELVATLEEQRQVAMKEDRLEEAVKLRDLITELTAAKYGMALPPKQIIPKDAKAFDGHKYAIVKDGMTWHVSRTYAETKGGHLARIESKEEHDFIDRLCKEQMPGSYWIDGSDELEEGKWVSSDNSSINYLPWSDNEPTNLEGREHHLQLVFNRDIQRHLYNDALCGNRFWCVIEWP